jgi:hypothetical protein
MTKSRSWKSLIVAFGALVLCLLSPKAYTQTVPPAWNGTATYAVGDLVTYEGNTYRCLRPITTHNVYPTQYYTWWEPYYVRTALTIYIGTRMPLPTLAAAWTYIQNARIANAGSIKLYIYTEYGDFNETFTAPFSLDHPFGNKITIAGDKLANVNLSFTASLGLTIDTGHTFGEIENVQVTSAASGASDGVYATTNASLPSLVNVIVNGFAYDIYADRGATVACDSNSVIENYTTAGAYAAHGASINLGSGLTFAGPGVSSIGSYGLYAAFGGQITAPSCTVKTNSVGILAFEGGIVEAPGATIFTNGYGAAATMKGHVDVQGVNASGDTTDDLLAKTGGTIDASPNGSTLSTFGSSKANGSSDGSYIYTTN